MLAEFGEQAHLNGESIIREGSEDEDDEDIGCGKGGKT